METNRWAAEVELKPIEATRESFKEYGQLIEPSPDGDRFGPNDAQLDLSRGIPRFYIMHLEDRPLRFSAITHHASVTQCLGAIGGGVWYLGVAKPSLVDDDDDKEKRERAGSVVVQSRCGHFYVPPPVGEVRVFKITGPKFVKLNHGTWHAGPLFHDKSMDFYNLELSDTNEVDHTTHNFEKQDGVVFAISDQLGGSSRGSASYCPPQFEQDQEESSGSSKRSRTASDGDYSISSNHETPLSGSSSILRPISKDVAKKRKRKDKVVVDEVDVEIRALRMAREEIMNKKIEVERLRQQEKLESLKNKMEIKQTELLNALFARKHLSPEEEKMKRHLMSILYGK